MNLIVNKAIVKKKSNIYISLLYVLSIICKATKVG